MATGEYEGDRSLPLGVQRDRRYSTPAQEDEPRRRSCSAPPRARRGGNYGTSLWGLVGSEPPAGYAQTVDKHAEFDKATLAALRKAVKKQGGEVHIGAVLEELGYKNYSKAEESRVAQSLVRLEWRKQATASVGYPRRWNLS